MRGSVKKDEDICELFVVTMTPAIAAEIVTIDAMCCDAMRCDATDNFKSYLVFRNVGSDELGCFGKSLFGGSTHRSWLSFLLYSSINEI